MKEVESYAIFKIAAFINSYWFPVLIPIGFVGNTLSFLVMIKQSNKIRQLVSTWRLLVLMTIL